MFSNLCSKWWQVCLWYLFKKEPISYLLCTCQCFSAGFGERLDTKIGHRWRQETAGVSSKCTIRLWTEAHLCTVIPKSDEHDSEWSADTKCCLSLTCYDSTPSHSSDSFSWLLHSSHSTADAGTVWLRPYQSPFQPHTHINHDSILISHSNKIGTLVRSPVTGRFFVFQGGRQT